MASTRNKKGGNRLVIVSNRLPAVISEDGYGHFIVKKGSGGLVTAMAPILRDRGGLWIGWPGGADGDRETFQKLLDTATRNSGYRLEPVLLTAEEVNNFYYGFANEILWPLFHDLQTRCNFDPSYWSAYKIVNRKFAAGIAQNLEEGDHIWVHDYHLMITGRELRKMGVQSKIGYFLHTPFPSPDLFFKLPWRFEIIDGMLAYDLLGFQTLRDRRNFVHCVQAIYKNAVIRGRGKLLSAQINGREVRIGNFPISIDYGEFAHSAGAGDVRERAEEIHREMAVDHIVLGIDRLDYTKGIPERLAAFELALEKYPDLHGNITLLQLVVPSRTHIPKYIELKEQVERKISEINGRFGRPGWAPVHYMFRSLERPELLAFYRAADVAFITPLKDGMNLVAKEYCAANVEENGVLILSEFAGARAQLHRGALLVNPYDMEGVARTLFTAIRMEPNQRRERMRLMRRNIRKQDIYWWVDSFLESAFVRDLAGFPRLITDFLMEEQDCIDGDPCAPSLP